MQAKIRKKTLFFLASHAPRNWAIAPGVTPQGPKYAQETWKGLDLPQASEMGHFFRANPGIILLQVNSLTLNNLHYIVLALCKAAKTAQVKEKIEILVF
jgi:hypothetical protein